MNDALDRLASELHLDDAAHERLRLVFGHDCVERVRHLLDQSIDGCGHAAVSATYAVAKALAGRAREAADYAAYATVYAQGGAPAVAERESFATEFAWQAERLAALARASLSTT